MSPAQPKRPTKRITINPTEILCQIGVWGAIAWFVQSVFQK